MNSSECFKLNTGQLMPLIGLGTAHCYDDEVRKAVRTALECGYRSIDTAYLYKNENAIGEELQDWFTKAKLKREDIFITSKLPVFGNREEDVGSFLKKSLENLKLSYLDLYIIHQPFGIKSLEDTTGKGLLSFENCEVDHDTDLEAVWRELEKQVDSGKTKAIGVSNFNSDQLQRILKIARIPPAVNQIEVHLRLQNGNLIKKCKNLGVAVVAYSPFGAPYFEKEEASSVLDHPAILEIGNRYGKSSSQVIIKFLVQLGLIVIPKSMNPARIASNLNVLDFKISNEDMKTLYDLDQGAKTRVYHFKKLFPGCDTHKEYPFYLEE